MRLDLATALKMISAAEAEAARRGVTVSIAVVDEGGNLVAQHRMDGACIATIDLSLGKAYSAFALMEATDSVAAKCQPGEPLMGLPASCGGKWTILGGGQSVWEGDTLLGGIGVSGAPEPDDIGCGTAGIAAVGASAG